MNNALLFFATLLLMQTFIHMPLQNDTDSNVVPIKSTKIEECKNEKTSQVNVSEKEQKMYDELLEISYIEDRKEWFVRSMEVKKKYPEYLSMPETIYDRFNEKELDRLFRVVESEATGGTFIDKVNVATAIFNRMEDENFPETIEEIITEDQFSPLKDGRFFEVTITEDTILACEYSFIFNDVIHDALYFDSTDGDSWAHKNKENVIVQGDNKHKFYK